MKICVFDVETRGLFGDIFKVGFFDGFQYLTFDSGIEFVRFLLTQDNLYLYAFNLEFDLSKLLSEIIDNDNLFKLDFDNTLVINGNIRVTKILGKEIHFKDAYPLVNCSLEEAGKSFHLQNQKIQTPEHMTKEDYFLTVPADDAELNEYLKKDCLCTYELVFELMRLSNLSQEEFVKCVTTASLSMKVFKTQYSEDFQKVKESQLYRDMEEFVRKGYYGGRTEIFKPMIKTGYHYDINSLYPHEMEKNWFPVGKWSQNKRTATNEEIFEILSLIHKNCPKASYMVHAKVHIPRQFYPPLPVKRDLKLIFPTGVVSGYWYRPEFEYALKNCGIQILEIYKIAYCLSADKIFQKFIGDHKKMKMESEGGKKQFAKTVQNSLYGKMAMERLRTTYQNYDEKKKGELEKKGHLVGHFRTSVCDVMSYNKLVFADYIAPQFSALITSFARLTLLKTMKAVEKSGDYAYYCDTDSIVCQRPLPESITDSKEYGKWKLERKIKEGIFILPKLYAEITEDGEEILKSKGIIRQFMETVRYGNYLQMYENLKKGVSQKLYGYDTGREFFGRYKILLALVRKKNLNERIRLNKSLDFSKSVQKRIFDYERNTSIPIELQDEGEEN